MKSGGYGRSVRPAALLTCNTVLHADTPPETCAHMRILIFSYGHSPHDVAWYVEGPFACVCGNLYGGNLLDCTCVHTRVCIMHALQDETAAVDRECDYKV